MKRFWLLLAVIILSFACSSTTIGAAFVSVSIDGASADVPVYPVYDGGYLEYVMGYGPNDPFIFKTGEGQITLSGELDPDPALLFASTAVDFGAPSTFSYTFVLPLATPIPNPSLVTDSFSGSVTNGSAAGGVAITALLPPPNIPQDNDDIVEMQVYTLSDNGGVTWKNVGLDNGPSANIPLGSFASGPYGSFNQGPIATIPGGPWTHIRADVNFQLSGGGDIFTFNGAKTLTPEPGSISLMMLGIGAMYGTGRRRRA